MIPKSGHRFSEKIMREKQAIAPETCKAVKPVLGCRSHADCRIDRIVIINCRRGRENNAQE
jgi:hypothetical protein